MQWDHPYIIKTGRFSSQGTESPVRIKELLRKEEYIQILDEDLKESVQKLYLSDYWKFKEDNHPKHTAKVVKKSFKENDISVLEWES